MSIVRKTPGVTLYNRVLSGRASGQRVPLMLGH